jgi:hypothetical protein
MLYYSSTETSLVAKAEATFTSYYGRIILNLHPKKVRLAAVQFYILTQELGARSGADLIEYRVIAAKLRSEFGTEPLGYIMTTDHRNIMNFGPIPRLWPRYAASSAGLGYWSTIHEYPLYALSICEHNMFPLFMTLESLTNLRSAYERQAQEALTAPNEPKKMQKVNAEGLLPEGMIVSLEDRKQAASGNCHRCFSPKLKAPHVCTVCGYVSRGRGL